MPHPVSQQFLDMLTAGAQNKISLAQIWNKNTALATLGTCTGGSVNADVTSQVRRTCTATIESQGLEYDDLCPTNQGSLLHPASGNELRLYRGFKYPQPTLMVGGALNGQTVTEELCPLGVFRMTAPTVDDQGDSIVISVTGNDRSVLMSRRTYTDVYPINPGTNLRTAIMNLVAFKLGDLDLKYKFVSTPQLTVPAISFGTSLATSNDPFADAISLSIAAALELYFDVYGDPVLHPSPLVSLQNSSFPLAYREGENCTYTDMQRSFDETRTFNGVIVVGVGSGGAPLTAEVWDTDPMSPIWIGGPWGKQPYIYQTALIPAPGQGAAAAQAQLGALANYLYYQVHTDLDIPSFTAVPNPALWEDDVLDLVRTRIGINGPYPCARLTMPLDTETEMTVTCRAPVVSIPSQLGLAGLGSNTGTVSIL